MALQKQGILGQNDNEIGQQFEYPVDIRRAQSSVPSNMMPSISQGEPPRGARPGSDGRAAEAMAGYPMHHHPGMGRYSAPQAA